MRHVAVPRESEGYAPFGSLTRSSNTLRLSTVSFALAIARFSALLVDVQWLDGRALAELVRLAEVGLRIILPHVPPPGKRPRSDYQDLLDRLQKRVNVRGRLDDAGVRPLVAGRDIPPFWARRTAEALYLFFGHPMVREVRYPLRYGQSLCRKRTTRRIAIDFGGASYKLDLVFEPYQSLLIRISRSDGVQFLDLAYRPPDPVVSI